MPEYFDSAGSAIIGREIGLRDMVMTCRNCGMVGAVSAAEFQAADDFTREHLQIGFDEVSLCYTCFETFVLKLTEKRNKKNDN